MSGPTLSEVLLRRGSRWDCEWLPMKRVTGSRAIALTWRWSTRFWSTCRRDHRRCGLDLALGELQLRPDTKLFSRLDNREVAREGVSSRRVEKQKLLLDPHRPVDTPVGLDGAGLVGSLGL